MKLLRRYYLSRSGNDLTTPLDVAPIFLLGLQLRGWPPNPSRCLPTEMPLLV